MRFGTTVRERTSSGGSSGGSGGNRFISWLKEGETTLQFLEEYSEWTEYYQHFDRNARRSYPCFSEDRDKCPGCVERKKDIEAAEKEDREPRVWGAQKFFLVNCLTAEGYVNLYQIPAGAATSIERAHQKYETITDREYTIDKYKGDDNRWKYDLERGDRHSIDLTQYQSRMQDHQTALAKAWNEMWGGDANVEPVKPEPTKADLPKENPRRGEDPTPTQKGDTMRSTNWNDAQTMEKPPSEPAGAAEPEQAEEAVQTIDEADLRKMTWKELVGLIAQCELPIPQTREPRELADYLIEKLNA